MPLVFGKDDKRDFVLRKSPGKKNGYAAQPGTGPAGECCKTCAHLYRNKWAKTYLKCDLMRAVWTGGAGTDVKASSPACRRFEKREDSQT